MTAGRVRLVGAEPSGLAELLAGLIEQHMARDPERVEHVKSLHRTVVVLAVPDAEVDVTVRIASGTVVVRDGDAPDAHLRVVTTSDRLLSLTAAPLRLGLPDPTRAAGRQALADVATGRVRVHGLARHPVRLARFTALLSVHELSVAPP